jgi:hypothetical protein
MQVGRYKAVPIDLYNRSIRLLRLVDVQSLHIIQWELSSSQLRERVPSLQCAMRNIVRSTKRLSLASPRKLSKLFSRHSGTESGSFIEVFDTKKPNKLFHLLFLYDHDFSSCS